MRKTVSPTKGIVMNSSTPSKILAKEKCLYDKYTSTEKNTKQATLRIMFTEFFIKNNLIRYTPT